MKRLFAPTWLGAWLAGYLPDSVFFMGKKTPWYRRSWMSNAPWLAPVLIAPFAAFLLWKVGSRLMHGEPEKQS